MKIEKQFKSPLYKFVIYESIETTRQRLQQVFDRTFGQVMWDIRFNIQGQFIDQEKSIFKIRQAGGIATTGGGIKFMGKISPIDDSTTEITLTPKNQVVTIPFWIFPLFVAGIICYSFVTSKEPASIKNVVLSAGALLGIYFSFKFLFKFSEVKSLGLLEDFEKVFTSEKK
ncbi:hypothetical protein [Larkinella rosea]|uniref:Uncharacterized protein n=1 Tax=Larkinella rosea TaxID=2025312 RepID=A0A3P1BB18_9BACT|nr:hypothetical protein [Larkinella rosea]RRA97942.1 hypothetical protein EHT25_30150 [Larkinella rosea]